MAGAFETIETALLAPVTSMVQSAVSTLSGELRAPMTAALTVYVAWTGWMILQGTIQEPVMDTIKRLFKACIVYSLATGGSEYMTYFATPMLTDLPNGIAKALNGRVDVGGNAFDMILASIAKASDEAWQKNSVWDIAGAARIAMIAVIFYISSMVFCIAGFATMLYAKMALGLVLALGPIFIACALFDATRRFSEAFVGTAVGFVILQALIAALVALLMTVITDAVKVVDGASITEALTLWKVPVLFLIGGLLFGKLPGIASGLGAGAYFHMNNLKQSVSQGWSNGGRASAQFGHIAATARSAGWLEKPGTRGAASQSHGSTEAVDRRQRGLG
jgi:type IV secretion system protein VirB6